MCLNKWTKFYGALLRAVSPVFEIRPVRRTNEWLKLLWTDWFQNLSDIFTLKLIVKTTVESEKPWFSLTCSKTYFEHCSKRHSLPSKRCRIRNTTCGGGENQHPCAFSSPLWSRMRRMFHQHRTKFCQSFGITPCD